MSKTLTVQCILYNYRFQLLVYFLTVNDVKVCINIQSFNQYRDIHILINYNLLTSIILFRPQRTVQKFACQFIIEQLWASIEAAFLSFNLFQGDEGRSTFAMSKLQWGAFRDANEKQDK